MSATEGEPIASFWAAGGNQQYVCQSFSTTFFARSSKSAARSFSKGRGSGPILKASPFFVRTENVPFSGLNLGSRSSTDSGSQPFLRQARCVIRGESVEAARLWRDVISRHTLGARTRVNRHHPPEPPAQRKAFSSCGHTTVKTCKPRYISRSEVTTRKGTSWAQPVGGSRLRKAAK